MLPLVILKLEHVIIGPTLVAVAHDATETTALAHTEHLGVGTHDLQNGLGGIPTTGTAAVSLGSIDVPSSSVLLEVGNGEESITAGMLGTLAGVRSNGVGTDGSSGNVALRNELGALRLVPIDVDGAFVDVLHNNRPSHAGKGRVGPGSGNGVVDMELANVRQTTGREGTGIRNLELTGVLLGIVVVNIDGVLLAAIALLDAVDAVGLRVVTELEERGRLIDASPSIHLDVAGLAGAHGSIAGGDGTNLVLLCSFDFARGAR